MLVAIVTASETPAELPSGRASASSFDDELGRETALARAPRARDAASRTDDPPRSADEAPAAKDAASADDATSRDDAVEDRSTDASEDFDDEALLLALLAGELPQPPLAIAPAPALGTPLRASGAATTPALTDLVEPAAGGAGASLAEGILEGSAEGTTSGGRVDEASFGAAVIDTDELSSAADPEADVAPATARPAAVASSDATAAAFTAALDRANAAPPSPAPAATIAGSTQGADTPDVAERAVPLAELPRLLAAEVDGFLKLRGRGRHWEAEIRLDPPELGALHVRLEMRGLALHGVVRVENHELEPELARFLRDLEQDLRNQGGEASFDFDRRAREGNGERERERGAERIATPIGGAALPRSGVGGAGPDASRLVDLLA